MPSTTAPTPSESTLHLPRILCLHGGGTNARIFRTQCRGLLSQLKSEYRLVFAEAAYESNAGPDVLSVYSEWAPFKRWLRWRPEHPYVPPETIVSQINQSLQTAMREDDASGATGEWVAILGFSQGAKVAASVLYRQQMRKELGKHHAGPDFRFGVLMAGRPPFVSLDSDLALTPALPDASQLTDFVALSNEGHVLRIPTLHVHGTRDPGIDLHRRLYHEFCDPDTRRLVEWDGDHRLPLKSNDVSLVTNQIRELAKETGLS